MSQNSQQPSKDPDESIEFVPVTIMGRRGVYAIPILSTVTATLGLLSSVVSVRGHISTNLSVVYINGLGTKSGDIDLINLVSSDSGFGIYLLAGNILLILSLVAGAITLARWAMGISYILSILLLMLSPSNVGLISSVTVHTAISDATISQTVPNISYTSYFLVLMFLIGISRSLPKKPKVNINYPSGKRTETLSKGE